MALLSLGLSPNAPKAGAVGAAGLLELVHSVKVGCGGTQPPRIAFANSQIPSFGKYEAEVYSDMLACLASALLLADPQVFNIIVL